MLSLPKDILRLIIEFTGLYAPVAQLSQSISELFKEYIIRNGPYNYTNNMPIYVKKCMSIPLETRILNLPDDMYYDIMIGSTFYEHIQEFKLTNGKTCLIKTTIEESDKIICDKTKNILLLNCYDICDLKNINAHRISILNLVTEINNIGNINELNIYTTLDKPLFLPSTLKKLVLEYYKNLNITRIPNDINLPCEIESLVLINYNNYNNYNNNKIMDMSRYTKMVDLVLQHVTIQIPTFPPNLKKLIFTDNNISITELPKSLEMLVIDIPGMNYPKNLKILTLKNINTPENIPESIQELTLINCHITNFPAKLRCLNLHKICSSSITLPSKLQILRIEKCNSLKIINTPETLEIIKIAKSDIIFNMSCLNLKHLIMDNSICDSSPNSIHKLECTDMKYTYVHNLSSLNVNKIILNTYNIDDIDIICDNLTELTLTVIDAEKFNFYKLPMSIYIFIDKIMDFLESRNTIKILILPIVLQVYYKYNQMIEIIKRKNIVAYHRTFL